jgi:hypothetical protein
MRNKVVEYQLPTPIADQTFTLSTMSGGVVSQRVQGQNVFMSVYAQGGNIDDNAVRTFKWIAINTEWQDIQPTEFDNFFAVLSFPNASWVLLEVTLP